MLQTPVSLDKQTWIESLRQTWAQFEQAGVLTETVAEQLARAWGFCRLLGADAGDRNRPLPGTVAQAAARSLLQIIQDTEAFAQRLPQEWDAAAEPAERDRLCLRLLEQRLDIQAILLAVELSLEDAYEREELSWSQMCQVLQPLEDSVVRLDQLLSRRDLLSLLASIADLPVLQDWRAALAEEYRQPMPWWLSELLDQVAARDRQRCAQELPSPALWRQLTAAQRLRPVILVFLRPRIAAEQTPVNIHLCWQSPDRRYRAHWRGQRGQESPAQLLFWFATVEEQPAQELAGQPVWFAGVPGVIEAEGRARFARERVLQQLEQGEDVRLEVGSQRQGWELLSETLQDAEAILRGETDADSVNRD
jgi:hypothetical protein